MASPGVIVRPIHRLLSGLPDWRPVKTLHAARDYFELRELGSAQEAYAALEAHARRFPGLRALRAAPGPARAADAQGEARAAALARGTLRGLEVARRRRARGRFLRQAPRHPHRRDREGRAHLVHVGRRGGDRRRRLGRRPGRDPDARHDRVGRRSRRRRRRPPAAEVDPLLPEDVLRASSASRSRTRCIRTGRAYAACAATPRSTWPRPGRSRRSPRAARPSLSSPTASRHTSAWPGRSCRARISWPTSLTSTRRCGPGSISRSAWTSAGRSPSPGRRHG